MMWANRISSIGLQFVLPAGLGWWLDRRWGTTPWLTVVGAMLGFLTGTLALIQLAKDSARADREAVLRRKSAEQDWKQ